MFLKLKNSIKFILLFIIISVVSLSFSYALAASGTINSSNHSALLCTNDTCTTTAQINFGYFTNTPSSNVIVTDSSLSGFIWGESFGWVVLNCSNTISGCSPTNGNFKVSNDGQGNLSGYAWGENTGWLNFGPFLNSSASPVTIDSLGKFDGWAWAQNYGWIKFDCSVTNACVETDWRPTVVVDDNNGGSGGGASFCLINPTNPLCQTSPTPSFCTLNPTDPSCQTPTFCTLNPTDPSCITQPFCNLHPTDPSCVPPSFCSLNPTDPTCQTPTFCTLNPTDPSCQSPLVFFCPFHLTNIKDLTDQENLKCLVPFIENVWGKVFAFLKTPTGDMISQIIIAVGALTGLLVSIATVLFANPLSLSELYLIPFRIWTLLLTALGIKKRNVPWGTVYDSVTKQPLDPAYVVLQDLDGKEVVTSITDIDGRYGFLVPAGKYRMVANKTNYEFPSKKLSGKTQDELYHDLYFNEIIDVLEDGVITKNIPMDPLKFDWNEFAKKDQKLMKFFSRRNLWIARISNILFTFGFLITIIAVLVSPVLYNAIILSIYLLLYILKRTILKPRAFGYIKQKEKKNPLSFAIIRFFFAGSDHEVINKVTDKTGRYYCLIPNGTYYTKIENKNPDESYSLIHTSEPIEVKNGYINKKFEI